MPNSLPRPTTSSAAIAAALLLGAGSASAFDINDQLSIGGILAAAGQCQDVSARLPGADFDADSTLDRYGNECRGGMPVQVEIDFQPNDHHQIFLALGWAVDNGLNEVSPFRLAPWAADLEADVKDINGSSRDYLLQAWYRYTHKLANDDSLSGTFGIIDSTGYLDHNEYASDEYTQFMNEAFVNAANFNLPSYDAGVAVESSFGAFSLNAVGMNINENEDGHNYNFWGVQAGWHPQFEFGTGNYRAIITGSSSAFLSPEEDAPGKRESLLSWGLSFDQAVGDFLGLFLRLTWQDTDAAVDYEALYSGGVNVAGAAWGRPNDNIGLGYAYLDGGNTDVRNTNVFEGYYRATLNDYVALTADIQYMSDKLAQDDPQQRDPEGWIFGLRLTAEF